VLTVKCDTCESFRADTGMWGGDGGQYNQKPISYKCGPCRAPDMATCSSCNGTTLKNYVEECAEPGCTNLMCNGLPWNTFEGRNPYYGRAGCSFILPAAVPEGVLDWYDEDGEQSAANRRRYCGLHAPAGSIPYDPEHHNF
jgi:hypothetical protein